MSGDWKRSYGANCDTGSGRKPPVNGTASQPTATAPVVDSTWLDPSRKGGEGQELVAGTPHSVLDIACQIAGGRGGEDVVERVLQLAALGGHRRGRRRGDGPRQGKGSVEPQFEPQGEGVVTRVERVSDVTGEVRQTGLLAIGVALLGGVAVRQPHGGPMPVHDLVHHAGAPRRGGVVHHRVLAAENPVIGVRALDAHARLVGRHHGGTPQGRQGGVAPGVEAGFGPAQHVGETALADAQAEQIGQRLLQTFVGQRLEGFQIHGRGVQARAERRRGRSGRSRRCYAGPASRAHHAETPVLLDERLHLRQFDPLVNADRLGRQIGRQRQTAVRAVGGEVVDDRVRLLGDDAAVALVAGLRASGAGLLALLLAIGGWRLGRRARRLGRALQLQHQLDQLVLAQTLEITTAHAATESAFRRQRKPLLQRHDTRPASLVSPHPVGNYRQRVPALRPRPMC